MLPSAVCRRGTVGSGNIGANRSVTSNCPRCGRIGAVAELLHGGVDALHGALAHARAAVQHAVDGGQADTRHASDVIQAGTDQGIHAAHASE